MGPAGAAALLVPEMRLHLSAITPVNGGAVLQVINEFKVTEIESLLVQIPWIFVEAVFRLLESVAIILLLCAFVSIVYDVFLFGEQVIKYIEVTFCYDLVVIVDRMRVHELFVSPVCKLIDAKRVAELARVHTFYISKIIFEGLEAELSFSFRCVGTSKV